MAKLYDKKSGPPLEPIEPVALQNGIETFLSTCRTPAVLEYGEEIILLNREQFALEIRAGRLWFEVWTDARSVSRRILTIERRVPGVLDCSVHRFGGKPGKLSFLDLDRPQTAHKSLSGVRQNFTEQFRRILFRQFPGWDIETVSCGLDLQRSFSSVFPRARLTRGNRHIAAMACPAIQDEPAMLTFALIWFEHVRTHARREAQTSLCLFLPESAGNITAQRLSWLNAETLKSRVFRFNSHGSAGEVDPQDLGNLDTRVSTSYVPPQLDTEHAALLVRLNAIAGVTSCPELNGATSIRNRGVEFARIEDGKLFLGLEKKQQLNADRSKDIEQFAAQLSSLGSDAPKALPERWMESAVRSNLSAIDPTLLPAPVHGQVLTFAAGDRDIVDLLGISSSGHLAVLEMKTEEDIHLPLQALDYWMRIRWHAYRNEIQHLFPSVAVADRAPKLLLVAPALSFHSSNSTILRYFSPQIAVERIGINSDWQRQFKVVLRLVGADAPISHESSL